MKKDIEELSLEEVCEWFIKNYPEEIFTGESGDVGAICVCKIREECKKILKGIKREELK